MVLPVGFDFADYQPAASRSYRPGGRLELLSAGRMSEEKGFLYSLDALRRVIETGRRDIRYSFTGEGYVRSQLEAYVDEHALHEHVRFLGRLTTAQVIAAMGEADALVLPSVTVGNWTENQACAVQEAMLMKALVITAQTGGVPESIPAVFKRFSAPERNAADLAQAITSVYDLTPAQLTELGHEGRKFVETGYDIEQLNRTMLTALLNSTRDRRVPFAK
jgi:glycosyltransferase involved in cell wall biosynthesis